MISTPSLIKYLLPENPKKELQKQRWFHRRRIKQKNEYEKTKTIFGTVQDLSKKSQNVIEEVKHFEEILPH